MAHETLRYRKLLGCDVKIFADAAVKHSSALASRDLKDDVEDMISRGCADAVIVTGAATGRQASLEDLKAAKESAREIPVLAGSGVDLTNAAEVLAVADGLIVGTTLKRDALTRNPVDRDRVRAFMQIVRIVRQTAS